MRHGSHFNTQVQQLLTEIELSLQWKGPIILFATYRSHHVVEDAEIIISKEAEKLGQNFVRIQIDATNPNPLTHISSDPKAIYSFIDLEKGGGKDRANTYRFLNLHREFFIERNLRCIFWVTELEIQHLALLAPDFWAFRHRVVDFIKDRATPKSSMKFRGLTWVEWPWGTITENTQEALVYRQKLIAELPEQPESTFMLINLYAENAGLYLQQGNEKKALETLQQGISMLPDHLDARELDAKLSAGLGIIHIQTKNYAQAYSSLQKALLLSSAYPYTFFLLAQISRLDDRRSEALSHIKKSLRQQPKHAASWNEAGNIYAELGRVEKALEAYQKAFDLAGHPYPLLNKSALLASTDRMQEAQETIVSLQFENKGTILKKTAKRRGFEFLDSLC